MKKYELTTNTKMVLGKKLFQIRALVSFGDVKEGELGGWIEKEENLSQEGDAWASENARVSGNARVFGDAWVSGNARVYGNARVSENARVYGNARVSENAWVSENARVSENAWVYGNAWVYENARVYGNAWVSENARVYGNARVSENAKIKTDKDYTIVQGFGREQRSTTFFRCADGEIRTQCGCFYGTIEEFRAKVKETHGDSKYAKEYLMIADLMEYHFNESEGEDE